jgi:tryptophanyl-tRNA synthetase
MRVLAGIQPSGKLHIGNYFGSMRRLIEYQETSDLYAIIVNLHALTTVRDGKLLANLTMEAALDFLALGINPEKSVFFIQSDVPEHAELTWYLSNATSMGLLERAHSYKDKISKGIVPNSGLFFYPVLMAADILLYQSHKIPVGKDQKQHVEMTRDIAASFNNIYGEIFVIPEPDILEEVAIIPGLDGEKMSKSYNNYIEIFEDEKTLKKKVMNIKTDSTPLEKPKNPDKCNVFALYKLFASETEVKEMRARYEAGGYGFGDAKKALQEKMIEYFAPFIEKRKEYASKPDIVRDILAFGAKKARERAKQTIELVRSTVGISY